MKLKRNSFIIALSGVSCALAVIFLTLGNWFSFLTLACYLFASAALMLPLAADSRAGGLIAYFATVLLGFLFGGIWNPWRMFLFCIFFGLHPLANSLQNKWNLNKWIAFAVKAVWFDVSLWLTWEFAYEYFFDASVNWVELIGNWIFLIIGLGGTVFFFFYDWAMRRLQGVLNVYVRRLRRGKGAVKRPSSPERRVEDVFGLEDRSEDRKEGASAAQGAAERPPAEGERGTEEKRDDPPQREDGRDGQADGEREEKEKREDRKKNGEDS